MDTDLDHKNIDRLINSDRDGKIKVQIKKETHRPEFARRQERAQEEDGIYPIWYVVPNLKHYKEQPYYLTGKRKGQLRDSLKEFTKFDEHGTLEMLDSGFVSLALEAFLQLVTARAKII